MPVFNNFLRYKLMKILQNWWQLSVIQIGGVICLPVIMIGQTLSQSYGFFPAVISILIGNAILLVLGIITAKMSVANRKTTMGNAEEYFGAKGMSFFALALMISLVCWFGIQLNMMSLGVCDLLSLDASNGVWSLFLNVALGFVMTGVALYGIKAVSILANLSLPFLLITIGYAIFTVDSTQAVQTTIPFSLGGASLVIALAIALVTDLPTYYRHASTSKDGFWSIVLIFGLVLPVLEIIGVYLASGHSEGNILDVLKREGGTLWNCWIAIFLILAGWTTNNVNLYSSSISLQAIFKEFSEKKATLYVGLAGTALSCFNLLGHFEFVLNLMGIFIGSMGAVVLTRYVMSIYFNMPLSSNDYPRCLLAWTLGAAAGFISIQGYSLTSIELLDAVIGASLGTAITSSREASYEKA